MSKKKLFMNKSLTLFLILLPLITEGQIFQYQRSNGTTMYSDRVPSSITNPDVKVLKSRTKESGLIDKEDAQTNYLPQTTTPAIQSRKKEN